MTRFDDWLAEHAAHREELGLTRRLLDSDRGEPLLDLAGNDYLGLARDRRVVEAAVRATEEFGAGAGASRLVTGTLSIHTIARARARRLHGLPGGAGVLDRLPREPVRGLVTGRRRHPGGVRRACARVDDRCLPARTGPGRGGPAQRPRRGRRGDQRPSATTRLGPHRVGLLRTGRRGTRHRTGRHVRRPRRGPHRRRSPRPRRRR